MAIPLCSVAGTLLALLVLALPLAAQGDTPPLRFWEHKAWTGDQGPQREIGRVAVSADGYLWTGASNALLRFDGISFTVVDSTDSPLLKSAQPGLFQPLLVDGGGTLWIARPDRALIGYREGGFVLLHAAEPGVGGTVVIDRPGRQWLTELNGRIFRLEQGRAVASGLPAEVPDTGIRRITPDTGDGLWIGTNTMGLWHVVGNHATRFDGIAGRVEPLIQSRDGTLWFRSGPDLGLGRLAGRRVLRPGLPWDRTTLTRVLSVTEDSTGAVWFATFGRGVLRWREGRFESYGQQDGLSDLTAFGITSSGGNGVWITTTEGLDRLRPTSVVTLGRSQGFSLTALDQIEETPTGGLWTHAVGSLEVELNQGGILAGSGEAMLTRSFPLRSLSDGILGAAGPGGIWVSAAGGEVVRLDPHGGRTRWGRAQGLPGSTPVIAQDDGADGTWFGFSDGQLGHLTRQGYRTVSTVGIKNPARPWLTRDANGHLWLAAQDPSQLVEFEGDSIRRIWAEPDGLRGSLIHCAAGAGDTLWASSDSGLIRVTDGRLTLIRIPELERTLAARPELVLSGPDLWILSDVSIARVARQALNQAAAGELDSVPLRFMGIADGFLTPRRIWYSGFSTHRLPGGRVWFSTPAGLALYDARWEVPDQQAPRPHILALAAPGKIIARSPLPVVPPNPDQLTIRFDASGGLTPERTRIQYRLEGVDRDWVEAGGSRSANYPPLRPGRYTFRVRAWSADGKTAGQEATQRFRIRPAWYQTFWFLLGVVLAMVGLAALGTSILLQRRNRRAAALLQARFDVALAERVRIAQELHDTLLQGLAGVTMQLSAMELAALGKPETVAQSLTRVRALADQAMREARDSVWDMRSPELDQHDLADALAGKARELTATTGEQVDLAVSGERRRLARGLEVTAFRIGREALANAVRHAGATRIEIMVDFGTTLLTLRIGDNGRGFETSRGQEAQRPGHWGLAGMRERARRAGGSCEVGNRRGGGTLVTAVLPLPGSVTGGESRAGGRS